MNKQKIIRLLNEIKLPNKWRPRVEIYVMNKGKILVGVHPEIGLSVPGGGIEPGQTIYTAAENECLEEAAVRIKNIKLVTKDVYYEDWEKLIDQGHSLTKKDMIRTKKYRGLKIYYVKADFDGKDKSKFGDDNDKLKRLKWVSKDVLIREYKKQSKDFDPPQYDFRIKVVKQL